MSNGNVIWEYTQDRGGVGAAYAVTMGVNSDLFLGGYENDSGSNKFASISRILTTGTGT